MHYGILRGLVNATYMIFIAYAPYVLMQQLGLNNQQFATIVASLPLCYVLGIVFLRVSLKYYSHAQIFNLSMYAFFAIGVVVLLIKTSIIPLNMWLVLASFALNGFFACPILVIGLVQCFRLELNDEENHNGSFSALLEFYLGTVTAIAILISSYLLKPKIGNLLTMFSVCVLGCLFLWFVIKIKTKKLFTESSQLVPFTKKELSLKQKASELSDMSSPHSTHKR